MTKTEEGQLSYGALIVGLFANAVGVFGVWFQGDFWRDWGGQVRGNWDVDELYFVLGLPAGVTVAGTLLFMWAVLGSPVAHRWPPKRRNLIFGGYAALLIAAITAAAILGSHHFWALERP